MGAQQPFVRLPDELLEFIADDVDSREDLLALALTCSSFCRVIIPERLYRSVVVSITNTEYLTRLSQKPRHIEHVYQVTVVNTTVVAPLSLRYGQPIPHVDWTKTIATPHAFLTQLREALALCASLNCLRLNSGLQDSFRMSEESINWLLDPHVDVLREVCLDITRFHTSPTFSLWKLKNLRTLELIVSGVSRYDWNDLCTVLENSPHLETLSLPSISLPQDVQINPNDLPQIGPLPHLPNLQRLSTPVSFSDQTVERHFYSFLQATPTITDLRWMSPALPPVDAMPFLPNLRRLRSGTASAVFLHRLLEGKTPGSIRLDSLECYRASMHPLRLLAALDPAALRALHMHDGALADIKALAQVFPNIEELVLPHMQTFGMRESPGLVQRLRESVALAPAPTSSSKRAYALLSEIVPHFPALRRVCHVATADSRPAADLLAHSIWWSQTPTFSPSADAFHQISTALLAVREAHPLLLSVNGWRLNEGLKEQVVLIRSTTGQQFLSLIPAKARFVLREDGFNMGYTDPSAEPPV